MRPMRIVIGVMFWVATFCALRLQLPRMMTEAGDVDRRLAPELWRYWTGQRTDIELRLPAPTDVAVGDPIFVLDESGSLRQVGEIQSLAVGGRTVAARREEVTEAHALLYPSAPNVASAARLKYFTTPDSLVWVLNTLLTPQRKRLIAEELSGALAQHQDEILAAIKPLVADTLHDAWQIAQQDLPATVGKHREEIASLGAKYEQEIIDQRLVPLVNDEIWPIVRHRAEPAVNQIGIELWERVSLWRFAWRAAYDRAPLPERRLLEQEWRRFVRQEAIPILARHTDDFVAIVKSVIQDASQNEAVRATVQQSLAQVAGDPEFQQLLWTIFDEAFVRNQRLLRMLEQRWTSPEAQQALRLASDRLEPSVRRIADTVFGTFEDGITPEFAQVLRTQILAKDRRWFLLEPGPNRASPGATTGRVVLPVELGWSQAVAP